MHRQMPSPSRYSPDIRITLDVDGRQCRVNEVGPDFIVIRDAFPLPPMNAILTVTVDDIAVIRRVFLPDGVATDRRRQPSIILETSAPTPVDEAGQART